MRKLTKPLGCILFLVGLLVPVASLAQSAPTLQLRLERQFGAAAEGDEAARPVFASGGRVSSEADGVTLIEDGAQLRRGGTRISSDTLRYDKTSDEIVASGNVTISRAGTVFTGPQLKLNLGSSEGVFLSPNYELRTTGGRGEADEVTFEGKDRTVLKGATYTTCACGNEDWFLKAESLSLDNEEKEGQGRNTSLHFKGIKLFTLPYFWFPLSDERRSGFLPPSLAVTSSTGFELETPYYLNLAPNHDLTIQPRIMSRRGLQLGADYRYLQPDYNGVLTAEYVPNDRLTGTDRYQWTLRHQFTRLGAWSGGLNLNGISDDNYFVDYGRSILATSERNLPRDLFLTRSLGDWQVLLRATQYRSILDARDAPPYQRLPQLRMTNAMRDVGGFDLTTLVDTTYFTRRLPGAIEGVRVVANPSISYPVREPGWFVVPKLSLHMSAYRLDANPGYDTSLNRALPTVEIDSGLIFERQSTFLGRAVTQTLEPRLYYAWTPYRNQDGIPIFDSGVTEFGFAQLFAPNLFVGNDRIADVNQLTAAMLSRVIQPETGAEQFRFAIGQRLYFDNQQVGFPGVANRTDRRSDILLAASGDLGRGISFDSGVQISLGNTQVPRFNLSWRYWPDRERIFNVGVRYQRAELGQIDTSFQWPLGRNWTALGRINYSWLDQAINSQGVLENTRPGVIESVIGAQYSADCWQARFVVQRFVTAATERTTAFFLQLELNGLGRVGTDPFDILRRNIPGFQAPGDNLNRQDKFSVYQ